MYTKHIFFFCFLVAPFLLSLEAQEDSLYSTWKQALEFGIDQHVITTIRELHESKNSDLAPEVLVRIQESKNPQLYEMAFKYFRGVEYIQANPLAKDLIQNPNNTDTASMREILLYISDHADSIDSIADELLDQLETKDINSYTAIVLGKHATPAIIDKLITVYDDDFTPKSTRLVILSSLTHAKQKYALRFLKRVLASSSNDIDIVQLALIALAANAEDSDAEIFDTIKPYLSNTNELTRQSAYAALAHIKHENSTQYLKQGIRDDNWRVRLQALEGIKNQSLVGLEQGVLFMVKHDPVQQVKSKALEVAVSLESPAVYEDLMLLLDTHSGIRGAVLAALLVHGSDQALEIATKYILSLPSSSKELQHIASLLPTIQRAGLEPVCKNFLERKVYALQIAAIRTITNNDYADFVSMLEPFIDENVPLLLKHEATKALQRLKK